MYPTATIAGNLGRDPEIKHTANGVAICSFSIAVNTRKKEGNEWVDGPTTWWEIKTFKNLAELCAEQLTKGTKILVTGRPELEQWEGKEGEKRSKLVLLADEVGLLIWGKAGGGTKTYAAPTAEAGDSW